LLACLLALLRLKKTLKEVSCPFAAIEFHIMVLKKGSGNKLERKFSYPR